MMMAMVEAMKYMSFDGTATCGNGDAVGDGSETANEDSACAGQYEFDPAKLAITVYEPGISGIQV